MRRLIAVAGAGLLTMLAGHTVAQETNAAAAAAPATSAAPEPAVAEGIVSAPPAEIWRVFTTGEGFTKLGPAKADVDLRIGGMIRAHYKPDGVLGDEGTVQNRILAFEPLRMLTIQIHKPPAGFPFKEAWKHAWTVMAFTDLGDGRTHVRIAMHGFGTDEESLKMREFFQQGNQWTLTRLQSSFDSTVKPAAAAHAAGPLDPIIAEAVIPAPRQEVWKTFTTSAGWKSYLGAESKIGSAPGGPFEIYFSMESPEGQRGSEGCTILSMVPGEMYSYSWNAPPSFAHARAERTWVVVDFEDVSGTATRVRLRHMGFTEMAAANPDHKAEWEQIRAYFSKAWPFVVGSLQKHHGPKTEPTGADASR